MIRTGVVGVGRFGAFHAEKHAQAPGARLVGVYDLDTNRAAEVASRLGTRSFSTIQDLLENVDAVSVAVPAAAHLPVAWNCLAHDVHVLLEKPMAVDVADAKRLIEFARSRNRLLQIGYLERFNPVLKALREEITSPTFIVSRRAGPYALRGTDIGVVMDLMVHDIDVILEIVQAPLVDIASVGASVVSGKVDIATVNLRFGNGCAASLTADRVAESVERRMLVFESDRRVHADFMRHLITSHRFGSVGAEQPQWMARTKELPESDALQLQVEDFLECVRTGRSPRVDGSRGLRTLEVAQRVEQQVAIGSTGAVEPLRRQG